MHITTKNLIKSLLATMAILLGVTFLSCKQGDRRWLYALRSINKASQIKKGIDTVNFTKGVKLLSFKRMNDTLNIEYYTAVIYTPINSIEMQAISVYLLPQLMRKNDEINFYADITVVVDTVIIKPTSSKLYYFEYLHSEGKYSAKRID